MNLDRAIPIVVHGDDAECHRRRSFMVLTWGSALVNATPWDSKILTYVGDNSQLGDEAYKVLDAWVAWSLLELMLGHYLDVDPWGQPFNRSLSTWIPMRQTERDRERKRERERERERNFFNRAGGRQGPIAGGWRGVFAFHKGDEKYIQKAPRPFMLLVSQYSPASGILNCEQLGEQSGLFCVPGATGMGGSSKCFITNNLAGIERSHVAKSLYVPWTSCCTSTNVPRQEIIENIHSHLLDGQHIVPLESSELSLMTTADFIAHGCRQNAWVCMPGWHVDMLLYDWLHVLDLAIVPDCAASALLELTAPGMGLFMGNDQDERLRQAYVEFQALCKQHKVRFLALGYPAYPLSRSLPLPLASLSLSLSLSLSTSDPKRLHFGARLSLPLSLSRVSLSLSLSLSLSQTEETVEGFSV